MKLPPSFRFLMFNSYIERLGLSLRKVNRKKRVVDNCYLDAIYAFSQGICR